jgi:hypothetical protein
METTFNICSGDEVVVGESIYTVTGVYTDIFTPETGCDSTVITTIEVVTPIDTAVTIEGLITLTSNEPLGGSTTFQWVKCDLWEPLIGETSQSFTATENGNYAVIVSKDFCVDSSECFTINSVDISEPRQDVITIYPNPSTGLIAINLPVQFVGADYKIYSLLGEVIYEGRTNSSSISINLSAFEKGIYFLHIGDDARVITSRITLN